MPEALNQPNGMTPELAELISMREVVMRRKPAKRGRHSVSGPSLSPLRGRGMEYAESREYQHGDDARHMDWRITARTGQAHTKVFQAERERLTLLVADTSKRMYFGTRVRYKSVQAARAGALAVWQALRDGDRVAALRGSVREEPVKPASGTRGVLRVLDALRRWYSEPPQDDLGLETAIAHAIRVAKPGTRVIVLADTRSIAAIPLVNWSALAQHSEVIVLALTDPLEIAPPHREVAFNVGGQRVNLNLDAESTVDAWDEQFAAPIEEARTRLQSRGVRFYALSTADDSDAWMDLLGRVPSMVA